MSTNRAVLTQTANRTKFTTDAKDYLAEVKQNYPNALTLQCIPEDDRLWERDHYEEFLKERRKILALELNRFLENITLSREASIGVSLDELIAEGESNELEFKSSLRWSYKEGAVNKKLEEVIVKSIAAFSNGEGGTLLIGVDDNGEILGLEHDYASLSGTRDEFELHLRNIINSTFGVSFAATNLIITFPEVFEHEICRIGIKHATAPCYVTVSGANGLKSEKLYARSGNSSIEVPLSEVAGYVETRFRK